MSLLPRDRFVEYSWLLQNLDRMNCSLLDVGCCDSYLCLVLKSLFYEVYGVDVRSYPFAKHVHFVQTDIRDLNRFTQFFSIIIAISTIEHVGLGAYGECKEEAGDHSAVQAIFRMLKPGGKFYMTVPYGRGQSPWYRIYTRDSLRGLIQRFRVETASYFVRENCRWVNSTPEIVEQVDSSAPRHVANVRGLACLKLVRPR